MSWRVKGSFGELDELTRKLSRVARMEYADELLKDIGDESIVLIEQGIQRQTDPYGTPWRPRKSGKNIRRLPVLRNLIGTFSRSLRGRQTVLVQSSDTHAALHQHGTKRLPKRLIVPETSRGLPKRWDEAFRKVAYKRLARYFRGR